MRRRALVAASVLLALPAAAVVPTPGHAPAAASASASGSAAPPLSLCIEHVPEGKARPSLHESFPARGVAGHAQVLEVVLEHGKGETVLPTGFRVDADSDEGKALAKAGFAVPAAEGGAGPTVKTDVTGETARSTVRISFVPLPDKAGNVALTLPSLPIAVQRASGEQLTLCTQAHDIAIEDPTASTPNAKPRLNPEPRRQLEEWTLLKQAVIIGSVGVIVGLVIAALVALWRRRPRPVPPAPPPRPPWEVAIEALFDIQQARLIEAGRLDEHFERVAQVIRRYVGDRYGFDGLESTTRETLAVLVRITPAIVVLPEIEAFLRQADLVKFARLTPTAAECEVASSRGEEIVRRTVPPRAAPSPSDGGAS